MSKLKINLPEDIVPPTTAGLVPDPGAPPKADPKLAKHKSALHLMSLALQSERGLKVRKANNKEAMALRFSLYRARTYVQSQGLSSFDELYMTVEDNVLTVAKASPTDIELL